MLLSMKSQQWYGMRLLATHETFQFNLFTKTDGPIGVPSNMNPPETTGASRA